MDRGVGCGGHYHIYHHPTAGRLWSWSGLGNKIWEVHKWVFVLTSIIITARRWPQRKPLPFVGITFLESTTITNRLLYLCDQLQTDLTIVCTVTTNINNGDRDAPAGQTHLNVYFLYTFLGKELHPFLKTLGFVRKIGIADKSQKPSNTNSWCLCSAVKHSWEHRKMRCDKWEG
jgi:hypothetical protein